MKKVVASVLVLALTLCMFTGCGSSKKQEAIEKYGSDVLKLYNWGEYMPLGKYGSSNIPEEFEKHYNATHDDKIAVVYSIYSSNEDMYAKLKSGSNKIDLIITSIIYFFRKSIYL